ERAPLAGADAFAASLAPLRKTRWLVYSKQPLVDPPMLGFIRPAFNVTLPSRNHPSRRVMATLIITEKTSQARDLAAALGSRYGKILPAEGHLLRLAEPDEIDPAWKRWSCTLLQRGCGAVNLAAVPAKPGPRKRRS